MTKLQMSKEAVLMRHDPPPQNDTDLSKHHSFFGQTGQVRALLLEIGAYLASCLKDHGDLLDNIQVVLAEVLNNIEEHSYAGATGQPISVALTLSKEGVMIQTHDLGGPMPDFRVPQKSHPDTDVACAQLPEGGFGWYLIHTLAPDPSYRRRGNTNMLSFRFGLPEDTQVPSPDQSATNVNTQRSA